MTTYDKFILHIDNNDIVLNPEMIVKVVEDASVVTLFEGDNIQVTGVYPDYTISVDLSPNILVDSFELVGESSYSINWAQKYMYDFNSKVSVDWGLRQLNDYLEINSVDWQNRNLVDSNNRTSLCWECRTAYDLSNKNSIEWHDRHLVSNDGGTTMLNWNSKDAGLILFNSATEPTAPVKGSMVFNTTDNHFYGYNGTVWVQLDNNPSLLLEDSLVGSPPGTIVWTGGTGG
jgi:hypothetical protein